MKTIYVLLLLLIVGCESPNTQKTETDETNTGVDSIIEQSKENLIFFDEASRKSDSSISKKVEKTVKQISVLKEEVKQLKEENNELKTKINDANDAGKPYQLLPVSGGKSNR